MRMQDYIVQCQFRIIAVVLCSETYFDKFKCDLNPFCPAIAHYQCVTGANEYDADMMIKNAKVNYITMSGCQT